MIEVGRLCIKIAGREAGRVCCVVKNVEDNFVIVTGPKDITGVKRRRCNSTHLEPLKEKIAIKEDASDADISNIYQKDHIITKLDIKLPVKREIQPAKEKKTDAKKEEKKDKKSKGTKKDAKKEAKKNENPKK